MDKEEKYGFVYLWYDRKHKRFYIGCRWGREDDGYICSSSWMKQAYKHRPEDFSRKILSRIYTNRQDLLEEEFRWLSMIKLHELKVRYYNVHNHHFGHWTADNQQAPSIKERISEKTKEAMQRPEVREKYEAGLKTRKPLSEEAIARRAATLKETWAKRSPPDNRKKPLKRGSPELSKIYSEASNKRWSKYRQEKGKI
jgi:hypothetical protein